MRAIHLIVVAGLRFSRYQSDNRLTRWQSVSEPFPLKGPATGSLNELISLSGTYIKIKQSY